MKPKVHPEFNKVMVTCACGNAFESMSTSKELKVEVCSACHPFFTGTQRFVDTAGRVERFQAKIEAQKLVATAAAAKELKKKSHKVPAKAAAAAAPAAASKAPAAPAAASKGAAPTPTSRSSQKS